eukprot:2284475-Prymnesium_polylepis.1
MSSPVHLRQHPASIARARVFPSHGLSCAHNRPIGGMRARARGTISSCRSGTYGLCALQGAPSVCLRAVPRTSPLSRDRGGRMTGSFQVTFLLNGPRRYHFIT